MYRITIPLYPRCSSSSGCTYSLCRAPPTHVSKIFGLHMQSSLRLTQGGAGHVYSDHGSLNAVILNSLPGWAVGSFCHSPQYTAKSNANVAPRSAHNEGLPSMCPRSCLQNPCSFIRPHGLCLKVAVPGYAFIPEANDRPLKFCDSGALLKLVRHKYFF